ncbi:MBL fold metallo-hydrolase [Elizabethkingia meningoseptica]|uniref:MBL fold metallo-hydrolase n=1 Tax=Elizabethkingia meningoseptica TaxID=238 RepID=UPI002DD6A3C0|nr:MBL fold metallo-hydrolase [Elizabethkingia meningoseptica]MEC4712492.1 MBL fold metallo-hydrolase [Elizabethkingia meningoseptica]
MRSIEAKFSFFKAGQGSFYGGRIYYPETNQVFTVVYDCGTKGSSQSLNSEIDYLKQYPYYPNHNNEIELLFISHLDSDHVSGLKRLLTEFRVKKIILPYIEKKYRQFFLFSIYNNDNSSDNGMSLQDYISFIDNPARFISQNSDGTTIYFIKPNDKIEFGGQNSNNDDDVNESEPIRIQGTPLENGDGELEFSNELDVLFYDNNLQFFIKRDWEFTTYVKGVDETAIDNLHSCLKKILGKRDDENLSFCDLKNIVIDKRSDAHKCYTSCIGDINSYGLVLLHGPIRFKHLFGRIDSDCELTHYYNNYSYNRFFDGYFRNENQILLGSLLFGDTSIKPHTNPVDFPSSFKDKLVNVHVVQVPHHGSSKNWDLNAFQALKIGENISRWQNHLTAVCNFGYGNIHGHPSHDVLNDLRSSIFLNSQFSRLNIHYYIVYV